MDIYRTGHMLNPVFCKAKFLDFCLCLVHVNDLLKVLNSEVKVFADDTSLFSVACDPRVTTT